jgi:hypothetical protein
MTNSYLTVENWFSDPNEGYGFPNFLSKRDLQDTSKGYLVGEGVLIECKIDVISVVNDFSSN